MKIQSAFFRAIPRRAALPSAAAAVVLLLLSGCGEDTKPQISALSANPECQALATAGGQVGANITFFARVTGGNLKGEPTTGVNAPLDLTWDFGDGQTASNVSLVTHRYSQGGEFTITATVKDSDGDADSRSIKVRVLAESEALTIGAVFNSATTVDSAGVPLAYVASFSGSAAVGCPLSALETQYLYEWDFGDGRRGGTGQDPVHRYPPTPAVYDVHLRVSLLNTPISRDFTLSGVTIPPPAAH